MRAVAVTALPKAPVIVLGAVNVQGEIIPVVNLRRLNSLPEREIEHEDEFILAHFSFGASVEPPVRLVALWVDGVQGVLECAPEDVLPSARLFAGVEHVSGAIKRDNGMVLIQDLAQALSAEAFLLNDVLPQNGQVQNGQAKTALPEGVLS